MKDKVIMLRGIGVGLILAAAIFFGLLMLTGYNHPEKTFEDVYISDEDVIKRAEELGMMFISDYLNSDTIDSNDTNPVGDSVNGNSSK
ncbi:MAG: hypothetical protein PF505_12690 [Vallitaleaceae bacterium]|jgi:hypothetical protein|nr:hypothetical protein [Vallitaleaceae bacterium]